MGYVIYDVMYLKNMRYLLHIRLLLITYCTVITEYSQDTDNFAEQINFQVLKFQASSFKFQVSSFQVFKL
jgi:hypothetical protein